MRAFLLTLLCCSLLFVLLPSKDSVGKRKIPRQSNEMERARHQLLCETSLIGRWQTEYTDGGKAQIEIRKVSGNLLRGVWLTPSKYKHLMEVRIFVDKKSSCGADGYVFRTDPKGCQTAMRVKLESHDYFNFTQHTLNSDGKCAPEVKKNFTEDLKYARLK